MRKTGEGRVKERGFTLIELMIAMAILGVLIAIAVPRFIVYRQNACDSQARTDARNFYTAAMAESLNSSEDKNFSSSQPPSGYNGLSPVSGSFNFSASTHTISCNAAFRHQQGSKTFTLDSEGRISASP